MLQLKTPGVYAQEVSSGVHTVVGSSTSVALFVGPTASGIDLRPQLISSFSDFQRLYGGLSQTSNLSYSVLHFFANQGTTAYVMRVPANQAAAAALGLKGNGQAARVVTLTALSRGASGNGLLAEIDSFGLGLDPSSATAPIQFNLNLTDRVSGRSESFGNLTTSAAGARVANAVINDPSTGSQLITLDLKAPNAPAPAPTGTLVKLPDITAPGTKFAAVCRLSVQVDILDNAGAYQAALGFTLPNITVFSASDTRPVSKLELVTRTLNAVNAAIRADAVAGPKMNGLQIEAALFEGGGYARFRISAPAATGPGGAAYDRRIYDATIRFAEPVPAPAAAEKSWLTDFTDAAYGVKAAPSRLQLGAAYPAAILDGSAAPGADGDASGQPAPNDFLNAVTSLDSLDPFFNTLCLPDLARPSANDPLTPFYSNAMSIYNEAALVCANKFAFLIIDPPCNVIDAGSALAWKALGFTFQSSHAGAWFPNIRVDDPLVTGAIRSHPPSGAIAGVIARMDGEYGVWQSPAGTDASLNGVYGPSVVLSDSDHGLLNPVGLNCIRQFPVYGTVGFGSRTVDGADLMASDYKYIAVRRVANYILQTLTGALRWAVHKPNGEELWSQLRLSVNAFMQTLFRQGAFKGVSAKDAYFVLCDSTTTTANDINSGIVNIVIGFAPLKPAEFVVISLTQIVQPAS